VGERAREEEWRRPLADRVAWERLRVLGRRRRRRGETIQIQNDFLHRYLSLRSTVRAVGATERHAHDVVVTAACIAAGTIVHQHRHGRRKWRQAAHGTAAKDAMSFALWQMELCAARCLFCILASPFGGSNPPTPANQSGPHRYLRAGPRRDAVGTSGAGRTAAPDPKQLSRWVRV
jgi:hypothetical protein